MKVLLSVFLVVSLMSCATKRIPIGKNKVIEKGVISISSPFVKIKKTRWAGEFAIRNLSSEKSIIIFLSDVSCKWGEEHGSVQNDRPFNIGEKTINIPINGIKIAKFRCDVASKTEGPLALTIDRVLDNPYHDGKTPGKVIAKNIDWSIELN